MAPRAGMADARRRALIGAALSEIAERGSLDVTVARIATRAGVSPALAHHYFGGKDDLILATMRHLLAEFREVIVAELARAETPRARLSAVIRGSFGPEQFHPATIGAWLTFYTWALSSPGAARLLRLYQRRLDSNLVHALRALVLRADARRIAAGLGSLIDGLYLRQALRKGEGARAAAVAMAEDYLDRQIGAAR